MSVVAIEKSFVDGWRTVAFGSLGKLVEPSVYTPSQFASM